ncbi:trypsin 5G1-like [Uranotaenia lowii]|uniref:trypsin 5G1-like n=1 Tax=Uranotaenia lowii TaxID=190385 RepID=UPI00247A6535|nr:trypsin 5G1-like [Uranotaenia lowii]
MRSILLICAVLGASQASFNSLRPWWRTEHQNSRIVGGFVTSINKVPWQVSLRDTKHICGGSIIGDQWVLTAGHCTGSSDKPCLSVRMGSSNYNKGGVEIKVKRSIRHPKYGIDTTSDYDFALLELDRKIDFTKSIKPIKLPKQDGAVPDGTMCTVSGWGSTQNVVDDLALLRAAHVPTIEQSECVQLYSNKHRVTDRMLCAGYAKGGIDACQGDSGGPLMCRQLLIGVVSWGEGCAEEGYPGVYARVASVRKWIKTVSGI